VGRAFRGLRWSESELVKLGLGKRKGSDSWLNLCYFSVRSQVTVGKLVPAKGMSLLWTFDIKDVSEHAFNICLSSRSLR